MSLKSSNGNEATPLLNLSSSPSPSSPSIIINGNDTTNGHTTLDDKPSIHQEQKPNRRWNCIPSTAVVCGLLVLVVVVIGFLFTVKPNYDEGGGPHNSLETSFVADDVQQHLPENWKQQLSEIIGGSENVVISVPVTQSQSQSQSSPFFWNRIIDMESQPAIAVLMISKEQQLVDLLLWFRQYYQSFSIKSGGHNKAGYSYSPNGFVIDLSRMNNQTIVTSSPISSTLTETNDSITTVKIQPGLHGLELIRRMIPSSSSSSNTKTISESTSGYGAVVGICSTVALGGFVLNGGYGWLSRQYGLGSDNLINVRIVTYLPSPSSSFASYDGNDADHDDRMPTIIDVNEHQYPDLFWAIRGAGGGSFGIVTEMEYRVYEGYQDWNYNGLLLVELADVPQFLVRIATMDRAGTLPRQFTMIVEEYSMSDMLQGNPSKKTESTTLAPTANATLSAEDSDWFSDVISLSENMTSPVAFGCAWVSKVDQLSQGKKFLQETLPALAGSNARAAVHGFPWTKNGASGSDFPPSPPQYVECFSGFVTEATLETMTNIVNHLHSWAEEWYPIIQPDTELWGGKISDVASNATAFPHRHAIFNVAAIVYVDVDMENAWDVFQGAVTFLKDNFHLLDLNGTYSNYQQRSFTKEEYPRQYFGNNIDQLVSVKQKYDPTNFFDYQQGIPMQL